MNIFYTNENPFIAANDHNQRHTIKMIVEYCQLLSTAHHVLDADQALNGIYKSTHQNHPSAVWCRSGQYQYEWVLDCALALCENYTLAAGKIHKTQATLETLKTLPVNIPLIEWNEPPIAAPDKFKMKVILGLSVCEAYQQYLCEKFQEWLQRDKPLKVEWYLDQPEWVQL